MSVREPREVYVIDLLRENWQADHPFGLTPKISLGWFNEDLAQPQITGGRPLPDEGPIRGGQTGYVGIKPDGSGPVRETGGNADLHIWVRTQDLRDSDSVTTERPQEYLTGDAADDGTVTGGVLQEIERIVDNNNVQAQNPRTGNTPVRHINLGQGGEAPEPDERALVHYVQPITYIYSNA